MWGVGGRDRFGVGWVLRVERGGVDGFDLGYVGACCWWCRVGEAVAAFCSAGGVGVHALLVDFREGKELICSWEVNEVVVVTVDEVDVMLDGGFGV